MGAPKQKWTEEEEAALKAGVRKHGTGKWRTILSDPEFSATLCSRSNVDLKDKWRNINASAMGGSRQRAKLALKKFKPIPDSDFGTMDPVTEPPNDEEVVEAMPIAISPVTPQICGSKKPVPRLDKLILEAITSLKEPGGPDKAAVTSYIKRKLNWAAPNLKKHVGTKLKLLMANGTLIKVKHKYRLAPSSRNPESKKSMTLTLEGRMKNSSKSEKREINILTGSQADADLWKMRHMTLEEAAAAAAQAIAEAEVAIAEAEEAAREAEAAEAEAEAAQIFAEAAERALRPRTIAIW